MPSAFQLLRGPGDYPRPAEHFPEYKIPLYVAAVPRGAERLPLSVAFLYRLYLGGVEGRLVRADDVVKPYLGLAAIGDGRAPGVDGVGLARDEAPIDSPHVVLLEQGHDVGELAVSGPRHVLGAYQRAVESPEESDIPHLVGGVLIVVVGDDVGVVEVEGIDGGERRGKDPARDQ